MRRDEPLIIFVDLFCGAGGVTTGIENGYLRDFKLAKVGACVNHDKNAILSHSLNHKDVLHFTEDIRTLDLKRLVSHIRRLQRKYANALLALWASLECTNFSVAKGGKSKDADSRTLAEHLFRYIDAMHFDYIFIENVREFLDWSPLTEKITKTKDGYEYCPVERNSKDKNDLNLYPVWIPVKEQKSTLFIKWNNDVCSRGYVSDYRILNCADFGLPTSRKRLFLIFAKHGLPIVFPTPTHNQKGTNGMKPYVPAREVLDLDVHGKSIFDRNKPLSDSTIEKVIVGVERFVGAPEYMVSLFDNEIRTPFLRKYHGKGDNVKSVNDVCSSITTKDRLAYFTAKQYILQQYSNSSCVSIDKPMWAMTTVPKANLLTVMGVSFLFNPQWGGSMLSVDKPMFTIIARMDKAPPYIVTVNKSLSSIHWEYKKEDSISMRKLRDVMRKYMVHDVYMRMLSEVELLRVQDFPDGYILKGTSSERKKYIGNAVPPGIVRKLIAGVCLELLKHKKPTVKNKLYAHTY